MQDFVSHTVKAIPQINTLTKINLILRVNRQIKSSRLFSMVKEHMYSVLIYTYVRGGIVLYHPGYGVLFLQGVQDSITTICPNYIFYSHFRSPPKILTEG